MRSRQPRSLKERLPVNTAGCPLSPQHMQPVKNLQVVDQRSALEQQRRFTRLTAHLLHCQCHPKLLLQTILRKARFWHKLDPVCGRPYGNATKKVYELKSKTTNGASFMLRRPCELAASSFVSHVQALLDMHPDDHCIYAFPKNASNLCPHRGDPQRWLQSCRRHMAQVAHVVVSL